MEYIYPKRIETTTGHSVQYSTQKITNPNNLCSDSKSLAYWGVKEPTWVGSYMRNYYDSITSRAGSYYTPETILATSWDTKNIQKEAKINSITIEYKWEQISYSCGTSACFGSFDKPTLNLIFNNKTLTSFKGAKPESIRYNNNNTNVSKINTNNAELSTLHSHFIDVSQYNLTIKDLNNLKIKFTPAKNTSSNHCRIVMQFLRIKIDYTKQEIEQIPSFRINKSSINPSSAQLIEENESEPYTYTCTIKSGNPYTKPTNCTVLPLDDDIYIVPNSIECIPADTNSKYDTSTHIWSINKFKNNQASLTFKAYSKTKGTKTIQTTINKYFDSIDKIATNTVDIIEPPNNLVWNIELENEEEPYIYDNTNKNVKKCLKISIERDQDQPNRNETIIVDTKGWITSNVWQYWNNQDNYTNFTIEQISKGIWKFSNIRGTNITIKTRGANNTCIPLPSGEYDIVATHQENKRVDETKNIKIYATDNGLPMDYFKLRLEDGSDIRYNSLIFSSGDDLNTPLTYDIEDDHFTDNIMITGEKKHIPTTEARYIKYQILSDKSMENVLCTLQIYDIETGKDCSDIIISCDEQAQIFNGNENKFCVIDNIVANEEKNINFIVQSDTERKCIFKLKLLNYDEYDTKWTPSIITFKGMPSIKMSITSSNDDINTTINDTITVNYCIENKSNVSGTNLKFQLHEPPSFIIKEFTSNGVQVKHTLTNEDNNNPNAPYFNEHKRMIVFPTLESASNNSQKYCLKIVYKATQKGIYNLKINTYDDEIDEEDDQWTNSVEKTIMVDISNKTLIKTSINKQRPYVNELIDFKINIKNYLKKQDSFNFVIKDIGTYETNHEKNDYLLEYYTCDNTIFTPNTDHNNIIGEWNIENIDINDDYELILTLRPQELGYHIIETTFIDAQNEIQKFENIVNVLENNKQINFRAYHAISTDDDINCNNCNALTEICDDDYIDLGDDLYYVCEVTNNNRNPIDKITHIFARLPQSFLENGILCSSHEIEQDDTNILHIRIPYIKGCSTIKICFKVQPSEIGTYQSNFMLSTKNSHVYHQLLTINVDEEFNQKKLEHQITIYNFEKTNHYFRYELDGSNNLFKFFNQGNDRSLRMVDIENYQQDKVEIYRGSNLKQLIRDISNNSKYVEPELLRIGNNHLATKGYELYPDGFIRRFGLLNSEVFHYTGQLPTIGNLVDKAMKWDVDRWDTKVWGGGIYNNGVFDLTIDYSKIPTNFNILEIDNPIKNLQALVDKTKPFGTQAICYYSAKLYLDLKLDIDMYDFEVGQKCELPLRINDIGLISSYMKHDNSLSVYYDLLKINLKTDIDVDTSVELSKTQTKNKEMFAEPYNGLSLKTDMSLAVDVFDQQYRKKYISECFDIVENIYTESVNATNIDIVKNYKYKIGTTESRNNIRLNNDDIYSFEYENINDINIVIGDNIYNIKYINDDLENFIGFVIQNENKIFETNFYRIVHNYNIQIQMCKLNNNKNVIHIFCSINHQEYIHIGYIIVDTNNQVFIQPNNFKSMFYTTTDTIIKFKIKDTVKNIKEQPKQIVQFANKNKWNNISNILESQDYSFIENNKDIDPECKIESIYTPTLGLKYNNINIKDDCEIIDIGFKFKAKSNKPNFIDDISIDVEKDGDLYIPHNNIASKIYYPNNITNINMDYVNSITLQQPNITICSNCLKTALGLYTECPYCGSELVSTYDEKKKVTVCHNPECGWIVDGHNNYCTHCLSPNVEQTEVDFNKTYCYNCGNLEDDYYPACPKCFSKNILHMNNDETKYRIEDKNKKNIETIHIKKDINRVNIFNLEINANDIKNTINLLEYLQLHIYGNNYNNGKFYYCSECGTVLLNYENKCPSCNNTQLSLIEFNNFIVDVYYQVGDYVKKVDITTTYENEKFDININIGNLVKETKQLTFKLLVYIENPSYDDINNKIEELSLDDKNYDLLVNNIPIMNFDIENIYYDYKYLNENEWINLNALEGSNHTGIKYIVNDNNTDYIKFKDFNIENDNYDHIYLNIKGINKADKHIVLNLIVTDQNDKIYDEKIYGIKPNMFAEEIDLIDIIQSKLVKNMNIQIRFENVQQKSEIIITHLFIKTEKYQSKNISHYDITTYNYNIVNKNDTYFINTNDLFGLRQVQPYYLNGKQLETNLAAFLNFGTLKNKEYIRLYNVEMIILYKNTYGELATEHIQHKNDTHTKQLINYSAQKNNAEIWGESRTSLNIINNLESDIFNSNNEESLKAIPLKTELTQSFKITENNIGRIILNYNGCIGYPNKNIIIQIFNDDQNTPSNLLLTKEIILPEYKTNVNIDINLNNLSHGQYWFKLIDLSADENNYHRFNYNQNTQIGHLIINEKEDNNRVLSFGVDMDIAQKIFYDAPTTLDLDNLNDFTTSYMLYRYNTKSINNAYLSDVNVETEYLYYDEKEILE